MSNDGSIAQQERATYEQMWSVDAYHAHSPGQQFVPVFLDMIQTSERGSVLDAGCGAGLGGRTLATQGFEDVAFCDLTDAGIRDRDWMHGVPFAQTELWRDLHPVAYMAKVWADVMVSPSRRHQFDGERFDWVYCCDVLEHVPTPFTMLVVSRLLEVARRGVFLSISTVPDINGVWVGTPLHQTVQSFVMWRDQLSALAKVKEARDFLTTGAYLLEAR